MDILRNLVKDMDKLLDNQESGDVVFSVNGREIRAHKVILIARSSYFAAMFRHDMKENRENRVEVTDVTFNVFRQVLRFIYTGICCKFEDMPAALFAAADKYGLTDLKELCEVEWCARLSVTNVCDLYLLADIHQAHLLKEHALVFIIIHRDQVVFTDRWKKITGKQQ